MARRQLVELGLTPRAIDRRVEAGRLHRLHRGVYLVGHAAAAARAREIAAVLACGPEAVLSHGSAAALWELVPYPARSNLEITVPARNIDHRPGIRIHRTRALDAREIRRRHGIPVTSPSRTLLDIAVLITSRELEQAVARALRDHLTSLPELEALLARHAGRRGARPLRNLIVLDRDPAFSRSPAEQRFLALVRRARLPDPDVNARVGRLEVDFLWRKHRFVVEVDGYRFHSQPADFERDRRRDAELTAQGLRVMRVTWRQLSDEPEATLVRVAQALTSRTDR